MHVAVTEEVGTLPPLILKSRNFPFFEIDMNSPNSCRELHTIQLSTSSFHPLKTILQLNEVYAIHGGKPVFSAILPFLNIL